MTDRMGVKVQLRMSESERERLRELAAGEKLSMSAFVRRRVFGPEYRVRGNRVERLPWVEPDPPRVDRSAIQEDRRGFRCPLPACRHQQKRAGECPRHGHDLVPVRL